MQPTEARAEDMEEYEKLLELDEIFERDEPNRLWAEEQEAERERGEPHGATDFRHTNLTLSLPRRMNTYLTDCEGDPTHLANTSIAMWVTAETRVGSEPVNAQMEAIHAEAS